jgi:hypothetical protein
VKHIKWVEWEAGRRAAERRLALIARGFPSPYRRERQRNPEEAELLRERGTQDELIGPEGEDRRPRLGTGRSARGAAQSAASDQEAPIRDRAGT